MLDVLSKMALQEKEVLDVGTGSGILALYCAMRGAHVTATDIDEKALHHTAQAAQDLQVSLHVALSDIFSNVTGHFDLIIFNPPYLPSATTKDRTVDGGKRGEMVAAKFLDGLTDHLRKDGSALLLLGTSSDLESLAKLHSTFEFSTVASRRLFFEELRVLQLRFRGDAAS
jgi:release factor glutamine methyltransferase